MLELQFLTSYTPANRSRFYYIVKEAIDAGCPAIQFAWEGTDLDIFNRAEWLRKITADNNVDLVINNRADIALAVSADALHIGQSDLPFEIARKILPSTIKIGWTLNEVSDLSTAGDADYFGVGPIFKSRTKDTSNLWGLDALSELRSKTSKPLVVIGGISTQNIAEVLNAGANGCAVIGDIYRSSNIADTVSKLIRSK